MRLQHLILVAACGLLSAAASAQPLTATTTGNLVFDAPTYENYGTFRNGQSSPGKAGVTIWLPATTALERGGRLPAVMIGHSIGGWKDSAEGVYVKPLLDAGFAVLGLDHFGPRGIKRAADVPGAISPITPVSDALLALKLVATHPRLDPARIGIMGLSMGGITAELSSYEFVRRKVLGDAAHEGRPLSFAAHMPFYAPCGNFFSNDGGPLTDGKPMLRLYGGKDETTARAKCDRIDALVRAAEPTASRDAIWYETAYHAWESPALTPRFYPQHVNTRNCPVMDFGSRVRFIDLDGTVRPITGPEIQSCIKDSAGYSMGYSPEAAQDAPKQMLAFFGKHLAP